MKERRSKGLKAIKDEEYYQLELLSYSRLASFHRKGAKSTFTQEPEDLSKNESVIIGSIVDDLLTNKDEVDKKYHIVQYERPTASLGVLTDLSKEAFQSMEECTVENVTRLAKTAKLWSKIVNENTYIKKFDIPEFWNYMKEHYLTIGKKIVYRRVMDLAEVMAETLQNDIDTKDAFLGTEDIEIQHQVAMLWSRDMTMGGDTPEYKSKFDIVKINHKEKTIGFIDIKTMKAPVENFIKSFYNFGYYYQDAMYQDALIIYRNEYYPEYEVEEPYNVVVSQSDPYKAYVFEIDSQWLTAGKYGFRQGHTNIPGYLELTEEYNWHKETKIYDYTRDEFQNGKKKTIKFNGYINEE